MVTEKDVRNAGEKGVGHYIFYGVLFLFGIFILFQFFFIVNAGERGLIFNTFGGLSETVYGEGIHFKVPFLQNAIIMNVRVQKQTETATAASKDLQDVTADVAVNFYLDSTNLADVYRRLGQATTNEDYMQTTVMNPIVQESIKSVTAHFTAEELITKRPQVKDEIDAVIKARLANYSIVVNDISITNFKFSDTFTAAIEAKVTAEQNALKEQNNLLVVQYQAQQKVEQAKGDAQAIEIVNAELEKSRQYVSYLMIQKWDGKMPLAIGSGTLLSITGLVNTTDGG